MQEFQEVQGLLRSLALRYAKRSGVPFDEMLAQAHLLYAEAMKSFDETAGVRVTTYIYRCVCNGLINYGKRARYEETRAAHSLDGLNTVKETFHDTRTAAQFALVDFLHSLPEDQKALVDLVLQGLAESMHQLQKIAYETLNYNETQFRYAVRGIRQALREMAA